ncbi:MAG: hypothetical protein OXG88_10360 [Gammaproteobacteria bacterium]|nr:hypothetical protein [Gammaproteobacteria bacterium]
MSGYPNQELNALRKSGQIEAAYELGQELMKQYPNNEYLKGAFGWVLYDKIKQVIDKTPSDGLISEGTHSQIRGFFAEYAKLGLKRGDLLFSLMARLLLKLPNLPSFFPKFLCWAGMHSFREEDFQSEKGSEGSDIYPSLVERLAGRVGKLVASKPDGYDRSIREFALELVEAALNKCQVQNPLWLRYRKGQLLCKLGQQKEAREHILYILKKKQGEYWAWQALADCECVHSPSNALAFYVKAYQTAVKKEFTVKVLEDIVPLARNTGSPELAKWAVDEHVSIRQKNEWSFPESLKAHLSADWYSVAVKLDNPKQKLAKYAEPAESLLFGEDSWSKANLLEVFSNKEGKKFLKISCQFETENLIGVVPVKRYPNFISMKSGAPVYAVIESGESRKQVLALKARDEGQAFDCLPKAHGVLDHHNREKELASVYLTPDEFCLLYYTDFREVIGWEVGCSVVVAYTHERNRYTAHEVKVEAFRESEWVCRKTDTLRIHKGGFGFVRDIFVPPSLVRDDLNGIQVSVVALKKPKKKDGSKELGWKAVSLKPATSNESL